MQVSWIDAERIKDLVAQIMPEEPCVKEAPGVVDIHTTPEALMGDAAATWGMDWMAPAYQAAPAAEAEVPELPPVFEAEDEGAVPSQDSAAATLPLSRIRDKLRAIRQHATEAGILTRLGEAVTAEPVEEMPRTGAVWMEEADVGELEAASPVGSPFKTSLRQTPVFDRPKGSREVRLAAFAGWARQVLHEAGGQVLVMSDDGEVLWGGEAKAGLVLSTMMAWGAAIRASAMSACEMPTVIHQPLASGNVLTVIPCETTGGMVHAAVAAPAGLTQEQASRLRGALCAAMN